MDNPIIDLLIVTFIIIGIYSLSRGRAWGYFVSCGVFVLILTILQCTNLEIHTYAGLFYLFLWSFIHIVWISIIWILCTMACWMAKKLRPLTSRK